VAGKKKKMPIKGVAAMAKPKSPLKEMSQAPIAHPKDHTPGKSEGSKPKMAAESKMHKAKKDANRRVRNKGRS
jgi:hypothetical protein